MLLPLYVDLATLKLVSREGGSLALPNFVLGDRRNKYELHFMDKDGEGTYFEKDLNVRVVNVVMGKAMEAPESGSFQFEIEGGVASAELSLDTTESAMLTALNAILPRASAVVSGGATIDGGEFDGVFTEGEDTLNGQPVLEFGEFKLSNTTGGGVGAWTLEPFSGGGHFFFGGVSNSDPSSAGLGTYQGSGTTTGTPTVVFTPRLQALEVEIPMTEDATPVAVPGCWLIRFDYDGALDASVVAGENTLLPESIVRWRAFQRSGVWWHELRLIQTPLVMNEQEFERVIGDPPSIELIRSGQAATESLPAINEIQALTRPGSFRGTYFITHLGRKTRILGIEDGPDEIGEALNALYDDGKSRFDVTNPEAGRAYMEFIGPFAGEEQDLMTATVNTVEPGVITFALDFTRAQLNSALRNKKAITVPMEIEVQYVGDDEDPEDDEIQSRVLTVCQQDVTIVREQRMDEIDTVSPINFLTPPARRNYVPFTADQIIVGQAHYVTVIGDGEATGFVITHNLGTADLAGIFVRENGGDFRQLTANIEYEAAYESDNSVTIDFEEAPEVAGMVVTICTAGPVSAFQAHTHTIGQIVGLQDILDDFEARVTAIEALLPTGGGTTVPRVALDDSPVEIILPNKYEVFPGRFASNFDAQKAVEGDFSMIPADRSGIVRTGLLKALHNSAAGTFVDTEVTDPEDDAGNVYRNESGENITLPGGLGYRSEIVPNLGYFGSDGRKWYRLTRDVTPANTTSYFPTAMERELFLLHVNEKQLREEMQLELRFSLLLGVAKANTNAQYLVVIETGTLPEATTPATTGENISNVTWWSEPILSQRVVLSSLVRKHEFGCVILRDAEGAFSTKKILYNTIEAGGGTSGASNFLLRARLVQFDVEDAVAAKGAVLVGFFDGKVTIS